MFRDSDVNERNDIYEIIKYTEGTEYNVTPFNKFKKESQQKKKTSKIIIKTEKNKTNKTTTTTSKLDIYLQLENKL